MAKFFSLEGQKERLRNVKDVLLISTGLKKGELQSNTGVKVIDKTLVAAAEHPFLTAGAISVVANPSGAVAVGKKAVEVAGAEFGKLSLGTKTALLVSAPIVTNALIASPKLREAAINAPDSLANFGSNVGGLVEDPSLKNLEKIAKENPIITTVAGATGLVALGAAGRGVAGIVATVQNTQALKENRKQSDGLLTTESNKKSESGPVLTTPLSAQPLTTIYPEKKITKSSAGYRKRRSLPSIAPVIRNIFKPVMIQVNRNG